MNVLFFAIATLLLIITQTVVIPLFPSVQQFCFDLMLILVLHLSLIYTHYLAVGALMAMGMLMDSISGAPFFLYTFSYLWVYLIVKSFQRFVFQKSVIFLIVTAMVAVCIQQGLMLFSLQVNNGWGAPVTTRDLYQVVEQALIAGVMIPMGAWGIHICHRQWDKWARQFKKQVLGK